VFIFPNTLDISLTEGDSATEMSLFTFPHSFLIFEPGRHNSINGALDNLRILVKTNGAHDRLKGR